MKDKKELPIIIKYIDAKENLSVQVHPLKENKKDECWYILDCNDDSEIIYGLEENIDIDTAKKAIENNMLNEYLHYVKVKKGDFIYIPAGTIHAILKNILLIEIQQNSNTTYRIYDWNRNRTLHLDNAKNNIIKSKEEIKNFARTSGECDLIKNQYFNVNKINVNGIYEDFTNQDSCYFFNVISAKDTKLKISDKEYNIKTGDSFIIPTTIKKFILEGNFEIVKTWL